MSKIVDLKIAAKIGATLVLIMLCAVAVSVMSLRNLSTIEDTGRWTAHTHTVLDQVNQLTGSMVDQETGVRGYLISADEAFLAPYRSGGQAFAAAMTKVRELTSDNAKQQERLAALDGVAKQWRDSVAEKEIRLMREPATRDEARRLEASGAGKASMDALRAKASEIVAEEKTLLTLRSAEAAAAAASSRLTTSAGLGAMVLVAILGLVLLHLGIARPIGMLTGAMGRLADKDLTVAIPGAGRGDEVGAMADAVGVFKENMIRTHALEQKTELARAGAEAQRKAAMREMADSFEQAVSGIVEMVTAAATELQATAQGMAGTATQTANQSTTVAAAAEEASANVNTVAAAAEELGSSVHEIGRQVDGSASLARAAVAEAGQTAALVQELSTAVSKIGDVVSMISTIAGQTNLLALNATIEAARAGEAGRGFAVVASEVKELATQTAKATDEISSQIGRIQGSTAQAVTAISSITARIQEISGVATTIAAAVEEQGAATQEIVRNVSQAATGTSQVTMNIGGVASAAEETGAAASQVLSSASELSRQSEHLSSEVARFLATVRAA